MMPTSRSLPFFWLLGVVMLVSSAAGASWVLYGRAGDSSTAGTRSVAPSFAPDSGGLVACGLGNVDTKHGTRALYPIQSGRVERVLVEEGQQVEEGAILLSVDKEQAQALVHQAEIALQDARLQLDLAKKLPEQQSYKEAQQKAAVEAAASKVRLTELLLTRRQGLVGVGGVKEEDVELSKQEIELAKAGLQAEEKKLAELQLNDPQIAVKRAENEVNAKQAQLNLATKGLRECDLLAPIAGTVVRLNTGRGDVLGPNPRQPAVLFLPNEPLVVRAELDQETAGRVQVGQLVDIEDYTKSGVVKWQGTVDWVAGIFQPRRQQALEPFVVSTDDNRFLECHIRIDSGSPLPRFGQRVRVKIKEPKS